MVWNIFEQTLTILNVIKDCKNLIEKDLRWFIDANYHNVSNLSKSKKTYTLEKFYNL